jgi:hypothetical protein
LPIISYAESRVKATIEQKLRGLTSSLIDEASEHKAEGAVRLTRNMEIVGPSETTCARCNVPRGIVIWRRACQDSHENDGEATEGPDH